MSGKPHDTDYRTVELAGGTPGIPAEDESPFAAGKQVGRFVVLDKVGAGGMGIVLGAYDPALDRKVAIKVLHPRAGGSSDGARDRLIREARAMAKLSHPNVLGVYEAGVLGDQVFIAMEFAPRTLREWLAETRPRADVLAVFAAAGRGLEAAHRAGLVHRDFKPENVLLGDDGRARVGDFGLAGVRGVARREDARAPVTRSRLTDTGSIMGTPAYMAPEQHLGGRVDGRADQFAFCVALYEALYGERPFGGDSYPELAENITSGAVRAAPAGSDVPGWLREVLLRGLARGPDDRFSSMGELLAALAADPQARRRRRLLLGAALGGAAVIAAGASVAVVTLRSSPAAVVCRADPGRLAGVWDGGRAQAVRGAFTASGHAGADDAFARVDKGLSEYTAAWVTARQETCRATHVRHEQSEALLDRRMTCLDRRLDEVASLVDLFARADAATVGRAADAIAKLSPLSGCEPAALGPEAVGVDPALAAQLQPIWKELARAKALEDAGRYPDGVPIAEKAVTDARAVGEPLTLIDALTAWGSLADRNDDPKTAERAYAEAIQVADRIGYHAMSASAWARLLFVVGDGQARPDDALLLLPMAQAAVDKVPDQHGVQASFLNSVGNIYRTKGDDEEALRWFERGLAAAEREGNPFSVGLALGNLGSAARRLGDLDGARKHLERAVTLWKMVLGPEHPATVGALSNLALVFYQQNKYDEAIGRFREVIAAREKILGPEHRDLANAYNNLASVLMAQGDDIALKARTGGEPKMTPEAQAKFEESLQALERAAAIWAKAGPDLPEYGSTLSNLGMVLSELGRDEEALAMLERAREIKEKKLGRDHPGLWVGEKAIAKVLIDLERPSEAVPRARRALALREGRPGDTGELAEIRFLLAQALWEVPGQRAAARGEARRALEAFKTAEAGWEENRAVVEAWLKERGR